MVSEGAAVSLASPSMCWCPPCVRMVVPLNGGSGVLLCCPRLRVVPVFFMVFPVFVLLRSLCVVLTFLVLCVVGGEVRWCPLTADRCVVLCVSVVCYLLWYRMV
nr:MAG TPA: hypothetical protein [Caudoviricetes sp.]